MEDEDSFALKVPAGRAPVCSHAGLNREIWAGQCKIEVKVGHQVWGRAEGKVWGRAGDQVRNLKEHRKSMLQSRRWLKTRQKNRRMNNAENNKQYNSPAALPI
jgi:hypothetical protein